jgi:hypothetical protein
VALRGVDLQDDRPRVLFLDRLGAVVEHGDPVAAELTHMVLPVEVAAGSHVEERSLAVQPPDEGARIVALDTVDAPGVPAGDEHVTGVVKGRRDRVDVEVVVWAGFRALAGEQIKMAVGKRHVVDAVPLPQQASGLDVDLLGYTGDHMTVLRAPALGQVDAGVLPVDRDQRGTFWGHVKVVEVGQFAARRADDVPGLVARVGDDKLTLAVACRHDQALKPG